MTSRPSAVVLGRADAVLAVPEAARAARRSPGWRTPSSRRPLVVACPTGTMAGQLADDLAQFLDRDDVELFPAWETLPFERVSPGVETMGRRLRVLHRLGHPDRTPSVIVASVRALLQRSAATEEAVTPVTVRPGATLDPDELVARLVHQGYRREELVEHRGEVARRGSIVDVFPSTADAPVRIDLWGDEVDRLDRVQRQRSALDHADSTPSRSSPPASSLLDEACALAPSAWWPRSRGAASTGSASPRASSSTAWRAGCRGSAEGDRLLTSLLPERAQVVLVEPRRMRDRAADLLAEEDDLARTLASTWGPRRRARRSPACTPTPTAC